MQQQKVGLIAYNGRLRPTELYAACKAYLEYQYGETPNIESINIEIDDFEQLVTNTWFDYSKTVSCGEVLAVDAEISHIAITVASSNGNSWNNLPLDYWVFILVMD